MIRFPRRNHARNPRTQPPPGHASPGSPPAFNWHRSHTPDLPHPAAATSASQHHHQTAPPRRDPHAVELTAPPLFFAAGDSRPTLTLGTPLADRRRSLARDPAPGDARQRPDPELRPCVAAGQHRHASDTPSSLDSNLGETHLDLPFLLHPISWPEGHFRGRNIHTGAPPPPRHG